MKVGSLVSMYIALDPRGIDFAYPAKFKTHSETVNHDSSRPDSISVVTGGFHLMTESHVAWNFS